MTVKIYELVVKPIINSSTSGWYLPVCDKQGLNYQVTDTNFKKLEHFRIKSRYQSPPSRIFTYRKGQDCFTNFKLPVKKKRDYFTVNNRYDKCFGC